MVRAVKKSGSAVVDAAKAFRRGDAMPSGMELPKKVLFRGAEAGFRGAEAPFRGPRNGAELLG